MKDWLRPPCYPTPAVKKPLPTKLHVRSGTFGKLPPEFKALPSFLTSVL
jgi:hypothetical protein